MQQERKVQVLVVVYIIVVIGFVITNKINANVYSEQVVRVE